VSDIDSFIAKNGYPVIIKPRLGMASNNVYKINNESEYQEFLEQSFYIQNDTINSLIIEEYVNGNVYSVDGIVVNNEFVLMQPLEYHNTSLEYSSGNVPMMGQLELKPGSEHYEKLIKYAKKVISRFPHHGDICFHLEAFISEDGSINLCEVASRCGGAKIPEVIESIYGVNIDEINILLQATHGEDRDWIDNINGEIDFYHGYIMISGEKELSSKADSVINRDSIIECDIMKNTHGDQKSIFNVAAYVCLKAKDRCGLLNEMKSVYNIIANNTGKESKCSI